MTRDPLAYEFLGGLDVQSHEGGYDGEYLYTHDYHGRNLLGLDPETLAVQWSMPYERRLHGLAVAPEVIPEPSASMIWLILGALGITVTRWRRSCAAQGHPSL